MKATKDIPAPAIRYFGGKWLLAPWIISHFPMHDHYIEPCGGAASVLLQKPRSANETYNDLDQHVVNFFKALRDYSEELISSIELTPWSRLEFDNARESRMDDAAIDIDAIERARQFWVYQTMSIGASPVDTGKGWRTCVSAPVTKVPEMRNRRRTAKSLFSVAARLQGVQIESQTMMETIERYDYDKALFYIDPPYVSSTRKKKDCYAFEWTDDDHVKFIDRVQSLKGFCLISGYNAAQYQALEDKGWHRVTRLAITSGKAKTESLWICPKTIEQQKRLLF